MSSTSAHPLSPIERICLPCDGTGEDRKGVPCRFCDGDGTVIV